MAYYILTHVSNLSQSSFPSPHFGASSSDYSALYLCGNSFNLFPCVNSRSSSLWALIFSLNIMCSKFIHITTIEKVPFSPSPCSPSPSSLPFLLCVEYFLVSNTNLQIMTWRRINYESLALALFLISSYNLN